jgi:UDP-N-acetyl-2-amino-2-deoxyglucuronate dehydrogenase
MSLKFALIGCGRIASNHIAAALENHLHIHALCDIESKNMEDQARKFGLDPSVKLYNDYQEMLEKERPALVAICTESGRHAKMALDAMDFGCHLIIEKPIALSLQDADQIIFKAKEKNLKVSACHQNRFNKSVQKIREALDHGRFGKLLHGTAHIRWNRGEDYYKQALWRGTFEQDGGALMNQCIHNIDLLRWMMGDDIVEVTGMTDNLMHPYIDAEDLGLALIRFSNGSYGIVEGTTYIHPRNLEETLYIFGEKGTVKAGGKSVNFIEEWHFADKLDDPEEVKSKYQENPPDVYGFGHKPLYEDVIDAIKNDREPYVTAEDGRRALELVLAIYRSAQEGKSIKLPLKKCSTLDFKGRFKK